mmetsp:Transcript_1540/g.2340  ORF Transcript_1540/g.2340 Transcript_1540/m.2340 type:complete len:170 (+) Transcript_1540:285-794(+)
MAMFLVSSVMYGFGDKRDQIPESLDLMNKIVIEYMEGMTKEAMMSSFNGQLTHESLQFSIRKDQRKSDRVKQLLQMYQEVVKERDLKLKDDAVVQAKATPSSAIDKVDISVTESTVTKKRKSTTNPDGTKAKRAKAAAAKKVVPAPKSKVSAAVDNLVGKGFLATLTKG